MQGEIIELFLSDELFNTKCKADSANKELFIRDHR